MQLGIDTSSAAGQVFLSDPVFPENSKYLSWGKESSHSEILVSQVANLLTPNLLEAIQSLVVINGPGSFTGLRVGVNFAKTLAYARNLPVYGINTLHGLMLSCRDCKGDVFAVVDAQKNSLFVSKGHWRAGLLEIEFENQNIPLEEIEKVIPQGATVCGPGFARYRSLLSPDYADSLVFTASKISLPILIESLSLETFTHETSWENLQPMYFKKSAAEVVLQKNKALGQRS